MQPEGIPRRDFLWQSIAGIAGAWLATAMPQFLQAREYVRQALEKGELPALVFFTPAQAADIEAACEQIIPRDENGPGARDAHVVYFIDRALTTLDKDQQEPFRKGLELLGAKAKALAPGAASFAALTPAQQIEVLKQIEKEPFFGLLRVSTMLGFFSDPQNGGNFGKAGWQLIGFDDSGVFTPPFGYYDEEAAKAAGPKG